MKLIAIPTRDWMVDDHFYTSHCTGDKVFATLKKIMGDRIDAFSCGMTVMV